MTIGNCRRILFWGFFILICGMAYLQLYRGDLLEQRADENYIRLVPQPAPRGIIFDHKGRPLVRNKLEFQIALFLKKYSDKDELLKQISKVGGIDIQQLNKSFEKNYLAPFIPTVVYKTDDRMFALRLEEKRIDGCIILYQARRELIHPEAFSHVIGYVNKLSQKNVYLRKYGYGLEEEIGYTGVEQKYNDYLRGIPGGRQIEVNSRGKEINVVAEEMAKKGRDISLTLDYDLQTIAYEHLKGRRASFVLMNVKTGALLSLVSTPSFDVNKLRSVQGYAAEVFNDKNKPMLNRPVQASYPLGSVFKPVLALAALETGSINENTEYNCTGVYKLGRATFKCNAKYGHGSENVRDAITHSCNVFFYNVGMRLGVDVMSDYGHMVGFGRLTNIDIPGEKSGILPGKYWKKHNLKTGWYGGDTVNMSIGQGYIEVTPIQVARMMSFFAGSGIMPDPYIVNDIGGLKINEYTPQKDIIDKPSLYIVRDGMRRVVADPRGTARELETLGMQIAGKTGTAQVAGKASHGWFAGFFPYRDPQYAFAIMIENAGSSHVAVDVLKTIFEDALGKKVFSEFSDEAVG